MSESEKVPALGIDLGTTTSLACVWVGGEPIMIKPDKRYPGDILPSVFCMTEEGPCVGKAAEHLLKFPEYRDSVIRGVKRFIDEPAKKTWVSGGNRYNPVQVSSFILSKLKEAAEEQLELRPGAITKAVITVPAYFGHVERGATRKAGKEAGFGTVQLLDEPIAAALGMKIHTQLRGVNLVLVFDLGGGTLDVTLLEVGKYIEDGVFRELGRDGHGKLGGLTWDEEIAKLVVLRKDMKRDEDFERDPEFFDLNNILLFEPCEQAKIDFSNQPDLKRVLVSYQDRQLNAPVDAEITRSQYTKRTQYLVDACALICDRLFLDIPSEERSKLRRKPRNLRERLFGTLPMESIGWSDIDHVYLVGGGSQSREVQEKIGQRWGKKPLLADMPQHQVVFGAAREAATLKWSGRGVSEMLLRSPHSYGFFGHTNGRKTFFPIIEKNCRVPATRRKTVEVNGKGEIFHVEIVEERKTIELRSGTMETIHSVMKRFSEPVPKRSELAEGDEQAILELDYRNDREITFGFEFRGAAPPLDPLRGEAV
ncbi:MAG: Hsp70 family protein [Pirellulaceae bacterium]